MLLITNRRMDVTESEIFVYHGVKFTCRRVGVLLFLGYAMISSTETRVAIWMRNQKFDANTRRQISWGCHQYFETRHDGSVGISINSSANTHRNSFLRQQKINRQSPRYLLLWALWMVPWMRARIFHLNALSIVQPRNVSIFPGGSLIVSQVVIFLPSHIS